MTDLLEDLAAVALLGTERRPPRAPDAADALGAALSAQPWDDDPAAAVLAAAALVCAHHRAGVAAGRVDAGDAAAAPPQTARAAPAAAGALLPRLTADADGLAHLPELLRRLAARGEHVPPTALPALLDRGRGDRALRPLVLRTGDRRAAWLAAQNAEWSWAADTINNDDDWRTGSTEARALQLADLRAEDPDAARDLVASTWDEDPPEARVRFLHALRPGLGPDDESLLERALDDRRKEVRATAVELLAALPTSDLQRRNAARLAALVTVGRRLDVRLPELPLDAATQRDRVATAGRAAIGGERAAALADLVTGAGLAFWPAPAKALKLADRSDFAAALHAGWLHAARLAGDPAWLTALAEHHQDLTLLTSLPPEVADRTAVGLLRSDDRPADLTALPGPWSRDLSSAILRRAEQELGRLDRPTLRVLSTRLHPDTLTAATDLFTAAGAADLLDLRQTILRELPLP